MGGRVVCTREPGGTALAEQLRELVLHAPMDGVSETLLLFAARRDHLVRVIVPALERGEIVLCDRFSDASFAYQGHGRGQSLELLTGLESAVHQGLQPDLTLWFDIDPELAAQRRSAGRTADRFESEDSSFFARVANGYRARMEQAPSRIVRIDAGGSLEAVAAQVRAVLLDRIHV